MVTILVLQCNSKERLNRLIAITWISEFIHLGGDALLPFHSEILGAVMRTISDEEVEIRQVAELTNNDLLTVVRETSNPFDLSPLLTTLTGELMSTDVATKMAALRWINMLLEKKSQEMNKYIADILPVLLKTLSDPSDPVVLLNLQVLSRISLHTTEFQLVMTAVLNLFASDRALLETRGSLIVRKFCVLLNAKSVYICMAGLLLSTKDTNSTTFSLEFISTMVQTLNLILLTAPELHELRSILKISFSPSEASEEDRSVFVSLFNTWCHNPVATFSLCLMAQAYDVSYALISKFAIDLELTVGILMQVDKLVQLLESPVFVHLRLQLLDVEAPYHAPLLKACYGLLMLLPQGDAFRTLNERLGTVCNLRDNLSGIVHIVDRNDVWDSSSAQQQSLGQITAPLQGETNVLDSARLLATFDRVMEMHQKVKKDDIKENQILSPQRRSAGSIASSTGRFTDPEEVRSAREGKV